VLSPRGDVVYAGGVHSAGPGARTPYLQSVLTAATSRQAIPFAAKPAQGTLIAYAAARAVATGPKARGFTLPDNTGATRRLSDFRGKWVILEWVNYDCPFVQANYHPSRRIIQTLQAQSAKQGIVWLSICSSARGKQGQFSAAQVNARMKRIGAAPTAYLHDLTGAVGRAYGAGYTPEIRIISPQGTIEYAGGVTGNRRRGRNAAPPRNHLAAAIADVVAGRPIAVKKTETFGCSVKY
ncbi:MAG: redoxin domain-containing protein, partial [Planctomycetota bacterium]|nr:redoxin domain-containing protein [Planctomycetota bacterium]